MYSLSYKVACKDTESNVGNHQFHRIFIKTGIGVTREHTTGMQLGCVTSSNRSNWQSVAVICIRLHAHRGKLSLMGSIILCRWQGKKMSWEHKKWSASPNTDCCSDDIRLCSEISFPTAQSLFININRTTPQRGHINPVIFVIAKIQAFFFYSWPAVTWNLGELME